MALAICAGALRRYLAVHGRLPKKPLIAMVPVSLHGETDVQGEHPAQDHPEPLSMEPQTVLGAGPHAPPG